MGRLSLHPSTACRTTFAWACLGSLLCGPSLALAQQPAAPAPAAKSDSAKPVDSAELHQRMVNRVVEYLETKGQAADGSFSAKTGPAVTGMVVAGLLRNGRTANDPLVAKGLKYLEGFVQEDGGIHAPNSVYKNYETSIGVMALAAANKDGRYDAQLKKADAFLKGLQWDGSEGHDESSTGYGGAGYGNKKRPDLSNTAFLVEALKATGNGPDSEAMQKALIFISRCQNLESPHNTTPHPAKVNDGGFYYTPFGDGDSQAGRTDNGGLRSYASMTYAGLKSMIFAGVGPDDPRVKAAFDWAQKNYDLTSNPGMGTSGLYYYYHTLAKALDAMQVETLTDSSGKTHDWRRELLVQLSTLQRPDGSFLNSDPRWLEGDPNLTSAYVLLTLSHLRTP